MIEKKEKLKEIVLNRIAKSKKNQNDNINSEDQKLSTH